MKPFTNLRRYLRQEFGLGHYKVRDNGQVDVIDPDTGAWRLYGTTGVDSKGEFCWLEQLAKDRAGFGYALAHYPPAQLSALWARLKALFGK